MRKKQIPIFLQEEFGNLPYPHHSISSDPTNHLKGNHLIFVVGDSSDPEFHTVRNFAVAANPKLMITVVLDNPPNQEYYGYVYPFECIMMAPSVNVLRTASYIIQDIFTAIALPGLVCLDFRDLLAVLTGRQAIGFSVRSNMHHGFSTSSDTVQNYSEELSKASSAFCYFSYDHKYEDEIDWLGVENYMDLIFDLSPMKAKILYGMNVISEQTTPFRGTTIIIAQ